LGAGTSLFCLSQYAIPFCTLSLDWKIKVEKDNEDKTLVKPEWLKVRRTEVIEIIVDGVDLLEEVRKSKVKDDEVVKAIEEIGVKMLRDEE